MTATVHHLSTERSNRAPLPSTKPVTSRATVIAFPVKAIKRTPDDIEFLHYGTTWFR